MDSTLISTRSYPPSSNSNLSQRRSKFFQPLSHSGMRRTPGLPVSPRDGNFSHHFSSVQPLMSPTLSSPPVTPMSPMSFTSPVSPPMSARSFGTFIESEPSTPAYSPRSGSSNWGSNTLLLLSPVSSAPSSTPASPTEPIWEMMPPVTKAKKPAVWPKHSRTVSITSSEIRTPSDQSKSVPTDCQKENIAFKEGEDMDTDPEVTSQVESSHTAPLGKLATRMKSILRRKTVSEKSEKKIEKRRRGYADLDRMEDVHWTEM